MKSGRNNFAIRFIKWLGSVHFAVTISVLLIIVLIISTSLESLHGTAFAQKWFYQTKWFDVFLSLLWINIFCATLLRFPFKKHQIGFLITHIGILGLLLGSLVNRMYGIEGQLVIFEGQSSNRLRQGGYEVNVLLPDEKLVQFDLRPGDYDLPEFNFSVERIIDSAAEQVVITPQRERRHDNLALRVSVQSEMAGLSDTFWLVEHDPRNLQSDRATIGPFRTVLKRRSLARERNVPLLRISDEEGQDLKVIELKGSLPASVGVGEIFRIENLKYYPYARVQGGALVNAPDDGSLNPALEFDVVDQEGARVHFLKFAYFPDFESIHGKEGRELSGLRFRFEVPDDRRDVQSGGPLLKIEAGEDGALTYRALSGHTVARDGEVVLQKWIPTGLMDISFKVDEVFRQAAVSRKIVPSPDAETGVLAAQLRVKDSRNRMIRWLLENQQATVRTPRGNIFLSLLPKTTELPFYLFLKDFIKENYPGTRDAASYESHVVLHDPENDKEMYRKIRMNEPLDYQGFRVFQSSYIQDPQYGEGSVFTVAKNPGITLVYLSCIAIFLGATVQFYGKKWTHRNTGRNSVRGQ